MNMLLLAVVTVAYLIIVAYFGYLGYASTKNTQGAVILPGILFRSGVLSPELDFPP